MSDESVVAIIPARSGSKGIKDKNIADYYGFPLMAYSIAVANMCLDIDRVIVSTDSEEYAQIALSYGAEVPFLRPTELSTDISLDIEYLRYTLTELDNCCNYTPSVIVLLRPTTPIRDSCDIEAAISLLKNRKDASAVVSVSPTSECPYKWVCINDGGYIGSPFSELTADDVNLPRQSFGELFIPDGYVDVLRSEEILINGCVYGKTAIPWRNPHKLQDIDSFEDFYKLPFADIESSEVYKYLAKIHR